MRYPIPEQRPDPLALAIAEDTLDGTQRAALATFVQHLATEMAGAQVVRPGTLLDQAVVGSGRWESLRREWDRRRADLYPVTA
ncbi:hypothetical protein ABZ799_01185 [Nocardiopsis dassonvillei]|uniref:hypothetical protein n=1 Tax=Nocardiopsis dassonvillei TaxID=2014 RepID=UPI0034073A48